MLGTKRPASSTLEASAQSPSSAKRLKPNSPASQHLVPLDADSAPTASRWFAPVWNTVKSLIGSSTSASNGPTPSAPRTGSRSRQRPRQENHHPAAPALGPFKDLSDAWIWQTMNAKQRGQPPPPEPSALRDLRERIERQRQLQNVTKVNGKFFTGTGDEIGATAEGAYQRKKPMGSRENTLVPSSRPRRLPTPEFLQCARSVDDSDIASHSSETETKRAQRALYNFVTRELPTLALLPRICTDSDSNRATPNLHPARPPHVSSSPLVCSDPQPRSAARATTPMTPTTPTPNNFFSSPWLSKSFDRIRRKQHRIALQNRDQSTLESLRSMPSTPSSSSATLDHHAEQDRDFRVYREGVRSLIKQEDEGQQEYRPSIKSRTSSSLLGPPSATYASILSASKPTTRTRPLSRVDRTLENYHKTLTESPAKKMLGKAELFAEFQRVRAQQEQDEAKALASLELEDRQPEEEQRSRKWPKKVPREIQDRVAEILKSNSYDKTLTGLASVDARNMKRLKPGTWLDDSIIAFYGVLINNRFLEAEKQDQWGEREERLRKVWCFNSFFWNMYNDSGYKRVKKWTKKFDVFEKDIIIFPININNSHWTCAAVNIKMKRFEYYDSLGGKMQKAYSQLRKWLQEEHECKKGGPIDLSEWEDHWDPDVPQQDNCNDCGVFTCAFMESLSREYEGFDFTQKQMPYLRQKIAFEIDQAKLHPIEDWE
ncbi:SUMO protease ULP1 [Sporobolomyces koalae]|uniref:SUMO protease ULP1 n=1 Tax=Sporobolomyces koalae TaxID=500713 RepID=UPI00318265A8